MAKSDAKLTKEESDVLFYFIQTKSMYDVNMKQAINFLPEFNGVVREKKEIYNILDRLSRYDYLKSKSILICSTQLVSGRQCPVYELEYGIKDRATYQTLYKKYKIQIFWTKFFNGLRRICTWIFDHLITILFTVITSVIITFVCLKLFGQN
jgi:hypothetical protein